MNLSYIFEHGDAVLISTFLILIGMSGISWYLIFWKAWVLRQEKANLTAFKQRYVSTPDWPKQHKINQVQGVLSLLIQQCESTQTVLPHYPASERKEILGMQLAQMLDRIRVKMDSGLTVLASIGSSAPFIGLFGTVWGIYGALTKIAAAGNASLNVVAGPMGEALVATAVGLFAAIPAVLAYNAYLRANRILLQDYRHIAEQLTQFSVGSERGRVADPLKLVAGE